MRISWGRTEFVLIAAIGWALVIWLFFLWDKGPDNANISDMRLAYSSMDQAHKVQEDLRHEYQGQHPSDLEYEREVQRITIDSHAGVLDRMEVFEDDMLDANPYDSELAALIGGRRAQRTAVAVVTIRDVFTSPGIEVVTPTPVGRSSEIAEDVEDAEPPSFIITNNVIFECERLLMAFDEAATFGDELAYMHVSNVMTRHRDEAGNAANFGSYEAIDALGECGR